MGILSNIPENFDKEKIVEEMESRLEELPRFKKVTKNLTIENINKQREEKA
jgi:hypothetical protein